MVKDTKVADKGLPKVVSAKKLSKKHQQRLSKFVKYRLSKAARPRTSEKKAPAFWTLDVNSQKKKTKRAVQTVPLRKSLTPGTVVILLKGGSAGKKAVILKQVQPSGMLIVAGEGKQAGTGLKRVQQQNVIATSVKVDIAGVPHLDKLTDAYFNTQKKVVKAVKTSEEFFADKSKESKKEERSADEKKWRKEIYRAVGVAAGKVPMLKRYLRATFALRKGVYPHQLKF